MRVSKGSIYARMGRGKEEEYAESAYSSSGRPSTAHHDSSRNGEMGRFRMMSASLVIPPQLSGGSDRHRACIR